MKLRAVVRRMLAMSEPAWTIFSRSLQISCMLLFCSFLLLLNAGSPVQEHARYITALALYETPQGVLLLGLILSVCLEDLYIRNS